MTKHFILFFEQNDISGFSIKHNPFFFLYFPVSSCRLFFESEKSFLPLSTPTFFLSQQRPFKMKLFFLLNTFSLFRQFVDGSMERKKNKAPTSEEIFWKKKEILKSWSSTLMKFTQRPWLMNTSLITWFFNSVAY